MRDIYLIDFENVASEGLSGITYLSEDDQVIVFYSNNSNRLTMKMHILIGKSVCKMEYVEATVGGKNALDHQIATWLGFLVGTGAAERNYYIVSRDSGYRHVANFWASNGPQPKVRCIDAIKVAGRLERNRLSRQAEAEAAAAAEAAQEREKLEQEQQLVAEGIPEAAESVSAPETHAEPVAAELRVEADVADLDTVQPPEEGAGKTEPESLAETPEEDPEAEEAQPTEEPLQAEPEAALGDRKNNRRSRSASKGRRGRPPRNREAEQKEPEQSRQAETKPEQPKSEQSRQAETKPEQPRQKQPKQEEKKNQSLDQLPVLIAPYPKLQEAHLRELISANKKQILCNTLRKQLGQEKGLALYNDIKRIAWR